MDYSGNTVYYLGIVDAIKECNFTKGLGDYGFHGSVMNWRPQLDIKFKQTYHTC